MTMRIIKRNSDNLVLFAADDLTLGADGVRGQGWHAPSLKPGVVALSDVEPTPRFLGGCYTHSNGQWAVVPGAQAQIDDYFAARGPTEEEVVAGFMTTVQRHMDAKAVEFGYDHLIAVISYAEESTVPRYQAEGRAFRAWRSLVWQHCENVFAAVKAGTRAAPSEAELLAELPAAPVKE